MKLLIDPHGDDCVLWASYVCAQEPLHILVTHPTVPRDEIAAAAYVFGCPFTIDGSDDSVRRNLAIAVRPDVVYAPAWRSEGHADHNTAALFADSFFGDSVPVRYYLTYAPRGQRDRNGTEVIPPSGAVAKKLRALSCFESQIENPSTRPWFTSPLLDTREWLA